MQHDLSFVQHFKPDIVILDVGTNDRSSCALEVVGSKVDNHVRLFMTNTMFTWSAFAMSSIVTPKPLVHGNICLLCLLRSWVFFFGSIENF